MALASPAGATCSAVSRQVQQQPAPARAALPVRRCASTCRLQASAGLRASQQHARVSLRLAAQQEGQDLEAAEDKEWSLSAADAAEDSDSEAAVEEEEVDAEDLLAEEPRGGYKGRRRRREEEEEEDDEGRRDGFETRVVSVSRVTKVVKGGRLMSFRAVVICGNENGQVGVGCDAGKEVSVAMERAERDAKKNLITVPLTKEFSIPHRIDGYFGAAKVMLRPASEGTGVIAGGAVRTVLELAGLQNCFGKQLGTKNSLNNARAAIEGLRQLRTFDDVAAARGKNIQELMGLPQSSKLSRQVEAEELVSV